MNGVRGLAREAERATVLMQRLTALLEPIRALTRTGEESALIAAERRLATLAEQRDPFEVLLGALARLERDGGSSAESAPVPRRLAASEVTLARRAPGQLGVRDVAGRDGASTVMAAHARRARSSVTSLPSEAVVGRTGPPDSAQHIAAMSAQHAEALADPAVAMRVLVERLQSTNTLEAFRTVVATPALATMTGLERVPPTIVSSVIGDTVIDVRRPREDRRQSGVGEVPGVGTRNRWASNQPIQLDAARSEHAHDDPARGGRVPAEPARVEPRMRALTAFGDRPLTGLRRLAALATEALDDESLQGVAANEYPHHVDVDLGEQLERLLRAEALAHGIDPDGLVR
jgi:hypothetical protein